MILLNVQVKNVIEKPYNDHLPLLEASRFILLAFSCCLLFWSDYNITGFILTNPVIDSRARARALSCYNFVWIVSRCRVCKGFLSLMFVHLALFILFMEKINLTERRDLLIRKRSCVAYFNT